LHDTTVIFFNSNTIVTVADNGALRPFVVTDGKLERSSKLPDFCRDWRVQTGGRSGINYRKGGFAPENGFKRNSERKEEVPVAKKQWGTRDGGSERRGNYRGGYRWNRRR